MHMASSFCSLHVVNEKVANEGVMDLVLNFMCSCKEANIDISSLVIFVGQKEYVPVLQSMGAKAMFNEALGPIPNKAADQYGDLVFAHLMWLKATSIYVASAAGFDVLFQVRLHINLTYTST